MKIERCWRCATFALLSVGLFALPAVVVSASESEQTPQTPAHPEAEGDAKKAENESGQSDEIVEITVNGVTFEMVRVDGGSFMMGSSDPKAHSDESPVHAENVATFYIGRTEVTQALWQAVMGSNPSSNKGDNLPVENVSWYDCQTFCEWLSELTGRQFRFPTEAEWEYAARGGNRSRGYKYSGGNNLSLVGWYGSNSAGVTHPVGTKRANELGIYDMSGNVREWTSDLWSDDYNRPRGKSFFGPWPVNRGGGWSSISGNCRSTFRYCNPYTYRYINLGMRLAF